MIARVCSLSAAWLTPRAIPLQTRNGRAHSPRDRTRGRPTIPFKYRSNAPLALVPPRRCFQIGKQANPLCPLSPTVTSGGNILHRWASTGGGRYLFITWKAITRRGMCTFIATAS